MEVRGNVAEGRTEPGSIGESAYRQIRSDILFGRLAPGQRLRLDGLKDSYGTSISTLREILSRLSSEGLVLAEEQRGFQVSPMSATNLRELAGLRLLLECAAMEDSFRAGDLDWEGRVVGAHHKLSQVEARILNGGDSEAETWRQYDWEFHRSLVSACGSQALMETYASVYDRYLRYLMLGLAFRGESAAGEHAQLFACAMKRDAATAKTVLMKHVRDCVAVSISEGGIPGQ